MNSHIYIGNYRITKSNYEVLLDLRIIISKQKKKIVLPPLATEAFGEKNQGRISYSTISPRGDIVCNSYLFYGHKNTNNEYGGLFSSTQSEGTEKRSERGPHACQKMKVVSSRSCPNLIGQRKQSPKMPIHVLR